MTEVDEYLKTVTPEQKAEFERIRKIVKSAVPEAEESISYGIPAFKHDNKPLLYFGAFKNHMSLFPASDHMIEVVKDLAKYRTSKGTLRFTAAEPISDALVKKIVLYRLDDIKNSSSQRY